MKAQPGESLGVFKVLPTAKDKADKRREGMLKRSLYRPDAVVKEISETYFGADISSRILDRKTCFMQLNSLVSSYRTYMEYLSDLIACCFSYCIRDRSSKRAALAFISEISKDFPFNEDELDLIAQSIIHCPPEVDNDVQLCVQIIDLFCDKSPFCLTNVLGAYSQQSSGPIQARLLTMVAGSLLKTLPAKLSSEEKSRLQNYGFGQMNCEKKDIIGEVNPTPTAARLHQLERSKMINSAFDACAGHQLIIFICLTLATAIAVAAYFL